MMHDIALRESREAGAGRPASSPARWPKAVNWLLWAAVAGLAACVAWRSATRSFVGDEFEAVHTAWLVSEGERPYTDFFQHHHPLLYYVLSPVVAVYGEQLSTLVACRAAMLLFLAGIFAATYWLGVRMFDRSAAILAVVFLIGSPAFVDSALEIRPDTPQALFGLLAIVLFSPKDRRPGAWSCFLAGASLGLAMLFLQKAVFTGAALGAVLVCRLVRKEARARDFVVMAAGGLAVLLPAGIWLVTCNSPRDYFFLNWTLNAHLARVSPLNAAVALFHDSTLLFFFAAIGVTLSLATRGQRELVALAGMLFGSLLVVRAPYEQYWIPLLPLLAVLAGRGLAAVSFERPRLLLLAIALLVLNPLGTWKCGQIRGRYYPSLPAQWEKVAYVLSATDRGDRVYDGDATFNLFRRNVDYLWFSGSRYLLETYQSLRPYPYNVYRLIDERRPKVICSLGIANTDDPRIRDHYTRSDRYDDLFIRRD